MGTVTIFKVLNYLGKKAVTLILIKKWSYGSFFLNVMDIWLFYFNICFHLQTIIFHEHSDIIRKVAKIMELGLFYTKKLSNKQTSSNS